MKLKAASTFYLQLSRQSTVQLLFQNTCCITIYMLYCYFKIWSDSSRWPLSTCLLKPGFQKDLNIISNLISWFRVQFNKWSIVLNSYIKVFLLYSKHMLSGKKDLFILQIQLKGNFWSLVRTPSSLALILHWSDSATFILDRCSWSMVYVPCLSVSC